MSQSWIHTNSRTDGSLANFEMRVAGSLSVSACANLEASDCQPKLNGSDRCEMKI